ncbi:unnamed protein product [Pleuronectes platessa]|uniref:SoHo domain-containing protein n=1 Tax=Pleuronectes platessa TaxID=8262 RepID=A0A9N7U7G4_PLEPL|nr:unnamed protein product [Pleuronectes platessa]
MLGIDPECADDLYEDMTVANESPEEAMLRKFFQAKPHDIVSQDDKEQPQCELEPKDNPYDLDLTEEEEEDPYDLFPEDIYDIVDSNSILIPLIQNRPPAPVPRSEAEPEPEETMNYITRVFSDKGTSQSKTLDMGYSAVRPVSEAPLPVYDPYAGMKTPGQRQLISLQERVKVGQITVDEAVQEFKSWQFDHERRANSIRYQQENLKKLRDSITRRHKEREKTGKDLEYEISAPLQRNLCWGSSAALECAVYEPVPRMEAPPPPAPNTIQRGSWKTGSTSSTSSNESNRLSIQSCSSGSTEPEVEDTLENLRPLRPSDAAPVMPPPRIPPRIPERVPENMLHERYISCPTRALPQRPPPREMIAPPVPRRLREVCSSAAATLDYHHTESCPAEGRVRPRASLTPSGPRTVCAVRITPLTTMKGSPDLIPAADLDPSRVCKGKGVVTLRATLVHIDDEGDEEPNVITAPSGWTNQINGDSSKAGLAEGGSNITADLPPVNNTRCQAISTESINQTPSSTDIHNYITPSSSSVYPCTSIVNPTIVLLQHNREQQKHLSHLEDPTPERDKSPDPGRESVSPLPDMDGKRLRLSLNSPLFSPLNNPTVPVRNTEKSKDWYKTMFKQIHRIPEPIEENPYRPTYIFPENFDIHMRSKEDGPSPLGYLEDVRGVPRSKSDAEFDSRGRSMPVPTRSSSLKPSAKRNEWEPPDKKVDTRKYRAEPKSIFEYEPGKSSVLKLERTSAPSFSPLETASDLQQYCSSKSGHSEVETDGGSSTSEPGAPECDRHVYKSVLEGGDIPLQGLRALNKRQGSTSSSKVVSHQSLGRLRAGLQSAPAPGSGEGQNGEG